jgi:biopolymer transport protein ExbB
VNISRILHDFFLGLGVEWVLWVLVALSAMSLAIIVERLIFYARRRVRHDQVLPLAHGDTQAVPPSSMERRVAERLGDLAQQGVPRDDVANAIEVELRKQRGRYENGLTFLATLGNNAPFVGLLGTVLGIMAAFFHLSDITETARKNELLMVAISDALVATAVGLIVAIPAVAFYNIFRKRVTLSLTQSREIVDHRMRRLFGKGEGDGGADPGTR